MIFQFLGTSSGTPTKQRNVSGIAVSPQQSKKWILVDCGEGTQHQLIRTNYSLLQLQVICITHIHGDHCYGLPGLLASAGMSGRKEPLWIIGPASVKAYVDAVMETTEMWLNYELKFVDVETEDVSALPLSFGLSAIALSHRVPSYAYSFIEEAGSPKLDASKLIAANIPKGPAWGKIQKGNDIQLDDGRAIRAADYLLPAESATKMIVAGDNDTPMLVAEEASDAQLVIHEATYTHDVLEKVGPGPQHSSARLVGEFAQAAKLPHVMLTHFSPRYVEPGKGDVTVEEIAAEASRYYDGQVWLAKDFDQYELRQSGLKRMSD